MAREHDDKYARESFSFRRMRGWQLWSITVVSAAVIVGMLIYAVA
ncbi:MAG: hypothetical protein ACFCUT_13950 [Kiloniellaceae bacterium]